MQVLFHILVILSAAAININGDNSSCKSEYSCIALYSPICAFNGKIYKTFSNLCELDVHNKCDKNNVFMKKYEGKCKKKMSKEIKDCTMNGCTRKFEPICAVNGDDRKTFSSECILTLHNCNNPNNTYEMISHGECEELKGINCEHYCPIDYEPICAFNGKTHKTFTNLCYLNRFNCVENDEYTQRFNGTCWNFEINCSLACSFVYEPICAYDGVLHKTFANECLLKSYNCPRNIFIMQKKFNGECGNVFEEKKCDHYCDSENKTDDVCGCNVSKQYCKDFANSCELRKYNCEHKYELKTTFKGKCKNPQEFND